MNGRSGYSNGYPDTGRHDHYAGEYNDPSGLRPDPYRGRQRRPGGYGGFQFEDAQGRPRQPSHSPAPSSGRGFEPDYRGRPSQSKSRSRTREVDPRPREFEFRPRELEHSRPREIGPAMRRPGPRDASPRPEYVPNASRGMDRSVEINGGRNINVVVSPQAIEGSIISHPSRLCEKIVGKH